jgi:hypothetical protein
MSSLQDLYNEFQSNSNIIIINRALMLELLIVLLSGLSWIINRESQQQQWINDIGMNILYQFILYCIVIPWLFIIVSKNWMNSITLLFHILLVWTSISGLLMIRRGSLLISNELFFILMFFLYSLRVLEGLLWKMSYFKSLWNSV